MPLRQWLTNTRDRRSMVPRRRVPAISLVLVGLLVAACSGGDPEIAIPDSTTTTARLLATSTTTGSGTPPSDPSAPIPTAEEEIVTRYQAFWSARFEANQAPPDPDHPGLAEYATGEQLETVIAGTRQNLEEGLALRRPEDSVRRSDVRVIGIKGDEALLQECYVDDGIVYRTASGEVVNDAVATHNVQATMLRVDRVWKLASTRLVQRWEGVAGCALDSDL